MNKEPLVSIVLSVYNGEKYLREAIESMLNQTYTNFEFLIINDGSTDTTEEIILYYKDERIRYVKNEQNLKLIASLNKGLDLAIGKYIARIDADDISMPERLEKQVNFMESDNEIGLLGSNILNFEESIDYTSKTNYLCLHDDIKFKLFFDTHFPHPTAFIRTEIIRRYNFHFDSNALHAEDYELWNRMVNVTNVHILQDYLVAKRTHPSQISKVHRGFQISKVNEIRSCIIQKVFNINDIESISLFNNYINGSFPLSESGVLKLLSLLSLFHQINHNVKYFDNLLWDSFCRKAFWHIARSHTEFGYKFFINNKKTILWKSNKLSRMDCLKWFIKSFLKIPTKKIAIYYAEQ
jgi:glycosyltransferase involved in cell wall biosynthesis